MKKYNLSILSIILAIFSLSNCAIADKSEHHEDTPEHHTDQVNTSVKNVQVPNDSQVVISINNEGKAIVTHLAKGALKSCKLCPSGQEKECAADRTSNYCVGLVNSTINQVNNILILKTKRNPVCWTTVIDGEAKQVCICLPGEDPTLCQ